MKAYRLKSPLRGGFWSAATLVLLLTWTGLCSGQVKDDAKGSAAKGSAAKSAKVSEAPKKVSAESRSIAVGQPFPDFTLTDQDGDSFQLSKQLKNGTVVLVVFRSADW